MKTNKDIKEKLLYSPPIIETIKLDNEISLAMESTPPEGVDEGWLHNGFNNDPYKQIT